MTAVETNGLTTSAYTYEGGQAHVDFHHDERFSLVSTGTEAFRIDEALDLGSSAFLALLNFGCFHEDLGDHQSVSSFHRFLGVRSSS